MAKLVKAMHRTAATPSPLNLFTSWISYLHQLSRKDGNLVGHFTCTFLLGIITGLFQRQTFVDLSGDADDRSRLATSVAAPSAKQKKWFNKFQKAGRVGPRGLCLYT